MSWLIYPVRCPRTLTWNLRMLRHDTLRLFMWKRLTLTISRFELHLRRSLCNGPWRIPQKFQWLECKWSRNTELCFSNDPFRAHSNPPASASLFHNADIIRHEPPYRCPADKTFLFYKSQSYFLNEDVERGIPAHKVYLSNLCQPWDLTPWHLWRYLETLRTNSPRSLNLGTRDLSSQNYIE